ncbi:MAG: helix-turn-helix transcriptional regulator [Adlercreutzia sp.]|nr:helix-turn-helix transcriptional regulator [Adlercreutzia sp.]
MLAAVLAAATCFSAFLASRSRAMILAFGGFLCYFIDVAFMLQDSIAAVVLGTATDPTYLLMRSVATIAIGDACLTFFWLLVCNFIGERSTFAKGAPPVLFLLVSLALLMEATTPEGRFWFYSLRMVYVLWILGYALVRYLACHDSAERTRLARGRVAFIVVAVLCALVIAEDALMFLVLRVDEWAWGPVVISAERNYAENVLMLACSLLAIAYAGRSLALRFTAPPADEDELRASRIGDNLALYGNRHGLTEREREVLRLILQGKDNQNIASAMTIAPSTVKVYVHRLLQKTGCENRQALIQDFWKEL